MLSATYQLSTQRIPVNDSAEITQWMQAPERGAQAQVYPIGAATVGSMGKALTNYAALRDAGAVAVSDDGKPILEDDTMRSVLRGATAAGLPVIQHAEDTRMTGGCSMNAGSLAFRLAVAPACDRRFRYALSAEPRLRTSRVSALLRAR